MPSRDQPSEDRRLVIARQWLSGGRCSECGGEDVIGPLIAYCEERLRVNVGLVMQNAELRRVLGMRPAGGVQ
jgi:hypothetical protein